MARRMCPSHKENSVVLTLLAMTILVHESSPRLQKRKYGTTSGPKLSLNGSQNLASLSYQPSFGKSSYVFQCRNVLNAVVIMETPLKTLKTLGYTLRPAVLNRASLTYDVLSKLADIEGRNAQEWRK